MKVGDRIKKLRELKNYTQQYMADQLELSISGYGKIERDETDISISRLEKIADVLGVDVHTILNFDEKHIFNFNNSREAFGIVHNNYSMQTELLEKMIQQYKEENAYLRELVKALAKA
jgi:transcriptional regulator with XRE-family HTH domain